MNNLSADQILDALGGDWIQPVKNEIVQLRVALQASLQLQSHYAELLNMHDGGARLTFPTIADWIEQLKKVKTL